MSAESLAIILPIVFRHLLSRKLHERDVGLQDGVLFFRTHYLTANILYEK